MSTRYVQPICPICLEAEANLCLPCGNYHWVHRNCWTRVINKTICPECRGSVIPTLSVTPPTSERSSTEEKTQPRAPRPPVRRRTPRVIDIIGSISDWYQRNGKNIDLGLDFILSAILQGRELARKEIDYVNRVYSLISIEAEVEPVELELRNLSIQYKPTKERVCLRCNISLPREAFNPRKRICKMCR
jgi:hypothetical protein